MSNSENDRSAGTGGREPVRRYFLTPQQIAERYPQRETHANKRERWKANRRRNRANGVDRFGRPLPRVAGTNPRALRMRDGV